MIKKEIDEQVKAIQEVTDRILKSKETTIKFLTDAGILKCIPDKGNLKTPWAIKNKVYR